MMIHADPISGVNFECLEIQDADGRYFQIQKSSYLCIAHMAFSKFKNLLNGHWKLYLSNKKANINSKNWPVYSLRATES